MQLDELNAADVAEFVRLIGPAFEHAGWVAERAAQARPFASVTALHQAMFDLVASAPRETQLAFIRNHPELAGKAAQAGDMTGESISEQGSAGLDRLSAEQFEQLRSGNRDYATRFGFPFLICVRRHTRASILAECKRRLTHSPDEEHAAALREIFYITRLRIAGKVAGPGMPAVDGILSTHVLDTARGVPAENMRIELRDVSEDRRGVLMHASFTTADGRTPQPLIAGQPLRIGTYELTFHVGDYFAALQAPAIKPAFLDIVPLRFSVAEPESHYHVPLLVTPWSYSTYRGS